MVTLTETRGGGGGPSAVRPLSHTVQIVPQLNLILGSRHPDVVAKSFGGHIQSLLRVMKVVSVLHVKVWLGSLKSGAEVV